MYLFKRKSPKTKVKTNTTKRLLKFGSLGVLGLLSIGGVTAAAACSSTSGAPAAVAKPAPLEIDRSATIDYNIPLGTATDRAASYVATFQDAYGPDYIEGMEADYLPGALESTTYEPTDAIGATGRTTVVRYVCTAPGEADLLIKVGVEIVAKQPTVVLDYTGTAGLETMIPYGTTLNGADFDAAKDYYQNILDEAIENDLIPEDKADKVGAHYDGLTLESTTFASDSPEFTTGLNMKLLAYSRDAAYGDMELVIGVSVKKATVEKDYSSDGSQTIRVPAGTSLQDFQKNYVSSFEKLYGGKYDEDFKNGSLTLPNGLIVQSVYTDQTKAGTTLKTNLYWVNKTLDKPNYLFVVNLVVT